MPIFSIKDNKFQPVTEKNVLEIEIQKLTEENLKTVFGLIFVSGASNQEFWVRAQEQDFYIDTLAFDEDQKSFVLIEYKKDKNFSVIDQGFAYLSAMLNHKADFVLELNERLQRNYKKNEIDWEQSRIIFISPEFTNYQKNAINFKDLPIELYEVRIYEFGLIDYNPIKPYRTTESIGAVSKDKTIRNVSKEVKVYTEDDLLPKGTSKRELYDELKECLLLLDDSLTFHTTKNYIGVLKSGEWRNYIGIEPYSKGLRIYFTRSQPKDFNDPKKKLFYRENSLKAYNQHMSGFIIEKKEDIEYACFLFKQLYQRFLKDSSRYRLLNKSSSTS